MADVLFDQHGRPISLENPLPIKLTNTAKEYVVAVRNSTSQLLYSGDNLVFDLETGSRNLAYNTSTGVFTLKANKTYSIRTNVSLDDFDTAIAFRVTRVSDGQTFAPGARLFSNSQTYLNAGSGTIDTILSFPEDTDLCIRVSFVNANEVEHVKLWGSGESGLVVQEI